MNQEEFKEVVEKNKEFRIFADIYLSAFQSILGKEFDVNLSEKDVYIFNHSQASVKKSGLPLEKEDLEFGATVVDKLPVPGILIVLHSHRQRSENQKTATIYHEFAHVGIDRQGLKFTKSGHEAVADFISKLVMSKGRLFKDIGWSQTFKKDGRARTFVLTYAPWYKFSEV